MSFNRCCLCGKKCRERHFVGFLMLVVFLGLSGFLLMTNHFYFHRRPIVVEDPVLVVKDPFSPKVILSWNNFFGLPNSYWGFPSNLTELGCRVGNCLTSNNRLLNDVSDAIIFHLSDLNFRDMPYKNSKHKWVLYNYEPPPNMAQHWHVLKQVVSQMTWFAMYRSDSDIETPYGRYSRKLSEDNSESDLSLTLDEFERKKSVAWLVSDCTTAGKREDFINILKRHIAVDVYGLCGVPAPCGPSDYKNRVLCYRKLAKLYKFYLSFENSVCKDYATEKVFLPLTAGLVPVVFGGANYSRILPPNSFIDALAFPTPKDLADHLLEVGRNFTLYQSYHNWRESYKIVQNEAPDFSWLCDLCRLLHEENPRASVVPIDRDEFYYWFFKGNACTEWKEKPPTGK